MNGMDQGVVVLVMRVAVISHSFGSLPFPSKGLSHRVGRQHSDREVTGGKAE